MWFQCLSSTSITNILKSELKGWAKKTKTVSSTGEQYKYPQVRKVWAMKIQTAHSMGEQYKYPQVRKGWATKIQTAPSMAEQYQSKDALRACLT